MPSTVNGVGTHYYGKRNRQSRSGICQSCGAQTSLESYDTRLWVVVLFIPVIPLGRKRIIDQCPRCTRHYAADHSSWEMAKQLNISGAMEKYHSDPSPENALSLHGQLIGFHMLDQAEQFRKEALVQHPESALVHAGLAIQLEGIARQGEIAPLFEKAHALRPDLPEARVGLAEFRMAEGRLDEARQLLDFLEKPGAGQLYSLGPLESLAHAYQRAGRHEETLQLCERLLAEIPNAAQIQAFRKFVAVSEKALRRPESVLPKRGFSLAGMFKSGDKSRPSWQRWTVIGAIVAALVATGMVVTNEYRRRHRTVIAVNDCGPAQVTIDGQAPVLVNSSTTLELPEGRHRVKIAGPVDEEFEVEMQTGYFDRWTKSPVWVLNIGGGTVLVDATLIYAVNPRPPQERVVVGENFVYFPHVDYPFQTPPASLKVDSKSSEITKTHLDRANEPAEQLFLYAAAKTDATKALRFGEARLRKSPEDSELLRSYIQAAEGASQRQRSEEFLKAGLWRQPVSIAWHREYQNLKRTAADEAELASKYDELLKASPRDAKLLYLRGRVCAERAQSEDFFRRASQADPALPWPWMALAYDAACRGDWQQARRLADKAEALKLNDPSLHRIRYTARIATGDAASLEAELRQQLQAKQMEGGLGIIELCDVLAAQGKSREARKAFDDWETGLPPNVRGMEGLQACRHIMLYMLGDWKAFDAEIAAGASLAPEIRLQVLAASGKARDALQDPSLAKTLEEPWNALCLSVALSLSGDVSAAATWREKACAGLGHEDSDSRRAAALLQAASAPSRKQLDEIATHPNHKALLVAALATMFPARNAELIALARQLNVSRIYPYHLVRKATEGAP